MNVVINLCFFCFADFEEINGIFCFDDDGEISKKQDKSIGTEFRLIYL